MLSELLALQHATMTSGKHKHYDDVTMSTMASQITSLTIVYSTVYSSVNQRRHQSSASLAFVKGIHRWQMKSPHKGPVTRKMFPFDDYSCMDTSSLKHFGYLLKGSNSLRITNSTIAIVNYCSQYFYPLITVVFSQQIGDSVAIGVMKMPVRDIYGKEVMWGLLPYLNLSMFSAAQEPSLSSGLLNDLYS